MKWIKSEVPPQEVKELCRRYGLDTLTAAIFVRRAITAPASVRFFLEGGEENLHNPFLMEGMADAVQRISAAVESGERILIYGDRDVDGITATVLMHEFLTELGADVTWMLPEGEEVYGLSPKVIEKAIADGIGLLVTVDCGMSNGQEIGMAAAAGIETVVIDHHNPPDVLPPALAIVNPKLPGTAYPFRDLCGCAVASKVEWGLRFSQTPFFEVPFCLLSARPANETVIVEAVRLVNMVETGRIQESIVPGLVPLEKTRLARFLEESGAGEILVLDAAYQSRMLQKAFGRDCALPLSDLSPLINEFLPGFSGMSLLKICQQSSSVRYAERPMAEIDGLAELFRTLVLAREKARLSPVFDRMDLVTLGTLADLMPLTDENRILVKIGLSSIRRFERRGLRQIFLRKDLLGKKVGTVEIAWQIAPLLNSAGRMGEPGKATRLFLSETDEEIEELVDGLFALDGRRKSMGEATWNLMLSQARESFERTGGRMVLVSDSRIQRGITGIMASRLQTFFKAPAVVVSAGTETAIGSIRSSRDGIIKNFYGMFSGFFASFGGHDFAGGFNLPAADLNGFLEDFYSRCGDLAAAEKEEESVSIDAEIPVEYLTAKLHDVVEYFEPYGEGNPPLAFLTRRMKIVSADLIGKKEQNHVKLLLEAGRYKWPAVFWNAAPRLSVDFKVGDTVDVVYRFGKNTYGGSETSQLTLIDVQK